MKHRILFASILLNVGLAAMGASFWAQFNASRRAPVAAPPQTIVPIAPATRAPQSVGGVPDWGALESADYPVFVANLRKFGCPDRTIEDILGAELDRVYEVKRQALRRSPARSDSRALERAIAASRVEERNVVDFLMGRTPALEGAAPESSVASASQPMKPAASATPLPTDQPYLKVPLPLALIDPGPEENFDERQMNLLQELRDQFDAAVGLAPRDSNDPEYLRRWQQALVESNARFRLLFGQQTALRQVLRSNLLQ